MTVRIMAEDTQDEGDLRLAIIRKELQMLSDELEQLDGFRSYYDGDQKLVYGTDKFKERFGNAFKGFRDNWTRVVVDAVADKTLLRGVLLGDPLEQSEDDKKLSTAIWEHFRKNDVDEFQDNLHTGAFVEGMATLIIWPDPNNEGQVTIDWNPAQLVRVSYEPGNLREPQWATKRWINAMGDIMVTYYTKDAIYKYVEREGRGPTQTAEPQPSLHSMVPEIGPTGGGLVPRGIDGEDFPLGNPLGRVPVVEFANKDARSELFDVIPQQDAVNYILQAQLVAAEFGAFGQRVMVTAQAAPDGGWKSDPGTVWHLKPQMNADGSITIPQFGTFDVTDPSVYNKIVDLYLQHMAFTSKTPVSYFFQSDRGGRGDSPSGEALKVDNKPLNDKVLKRQRILGNRWMRAFRLVAASTGLADFDAVPLGEPIWEDPRAENRMALLDEAVKLIALEFPRKYVWKTLGLTADEMKAAEKLFEEQRTEDDKRAEAEAEMQAKVAADNRPEPSGSNSSSGGGVKGPGKTSKA